MIPTSYRTLLSATWKITHFFAIPVEQLRARFASLRCLEYDASQRRWVWLYTAEARTLPFKDRRASKDVV